MELKIFNISRHVPQSTVRILFSILGDILFFDYYSSISRRDGTFECVIVYRELSEAQLAAKLDGTELGDRCLEARLSQSIDRFDISFEPNNSSVLGSRTLLIKSEDMATDIEKISADFEGISRLIELERDLGAGLPPLSARFFLVEFLTIEAAEAALKHPNYIVAEAQKHMQSYTVGNVSGHLPASASVAVPPSSTEEVLIYGVPASKLLDPTTTRSYARSSDVKDKSSKSSSYYRSSRSKSKSRSRSPGGRRDHYESRGRERDYDYDRYRRDRRRSRSRSGGERRRRQ